MQLLNQRPFLFWFTGLSGSGKSAMALRLERFLFENNFKAYLLDGDILRSGLNSDLGFSDEDRKENIRRTGELCRLMLDAGLIVITAFISPFRADREKIRSLAGAENFAEIYMNADVRVCETRDVKGLYERARKGEIKNFTGIDSPYEIPEHPDLVLNSGTDSEDQTFTVLKEFVSGRINL